VFTLASSACSPCFVRRKEWYELSSHGKQAGITKAVPDPLISNIYRQRAKKEAKKFAYSRDIRYTFSTC